MVAETKSIIGKAYAYQGKLDVALSIFRSILIIYEELEYNKQIADTLNAIGGINSYQGNYDQALKYYLRSLKVREAINQEKGVAMSLGNIAELYKEMDRVEEAIDCFEKAIKLQHSLYTADFVLQLVELRIRLGEVEKAYAEIELAKSFIIASENKNVDQKIMLAEALVLKFSKRNRDRGQAELLLNEIIKGDKFDQFTTQKAIIHLCELLFTELLNSGDPGILEELNHLAIQLENMAKQQNSAVALTETYIALMKLKLINGDIISAKKLLLQAELLATESNLGKLQMQISNEFDFILQKEKELENNLSIKDLVKMTNVGETIASMTGIHADEEIEIEVENQVLISIMNTLGASVYSKSFNALLSEKIDPQLFGSFLSALNSFGGELFDGSLERARLGEYNLILKPINEHFMLCYVFMGPSYHASKKVNLVIIEFAVCDDLKIFDTNSSGIISVFSDDVDAINKMVEKVFLSS